MLAAGEPPLQRKKVNLIVSCAENRVIGKDGRMPWRLPEDWRLFQRRTAGQIVILGRICFDTWPGATRDGRRALVITSRALPAGSPALASASLPAALSAAGKLPGEIFVCGGQAIYEEALALGGPLRLFLTLVHARVPGDRFFPEWRHLPWQEIERRAVADGGFETTQFVLELG